MELVVLVTCGAKGRSVLFEAARGAGVVGFADRVLGLRMEVVPSTTADAHDLTWVRFTRKMMRNGEARENSQLTGFGKGKPLAHTVSCRYRSMAFLVRLSDGSGSRRRS